MFFERSLNSIFRAFRFKNNFMTDLRFKNYLITNDFERIDRKRAELDLETVLPLSRDEQEFYVQLSSLNLVKVEIQFLLDKSFFLMMSTFHVFGMLIADYSLYWFLSMVHFYGSQENGIAKESKLKNSKLFNSD